MPFPYPPPRKRGLLRFILLGVTVLLVVGSVALTYGLLFGGGGPNEPAVVTQTIVKGAADQRIAVVALAGEIDEPAAARFRRLVDRVEADAEVRALVVEVDTPGGTVTASDEMYDRLLRYKRRRADAGRSPLVVVSMKGQATSGGYYVACAADRVLAEPTTETGNIGVLMFRFNFSGLMEKYGVRETTTVATGADFKHLGSPFQPEDPKTEQDLRRRIDQAFARFKEVVRAGRGTALDEPEVFSGKVFTAKEALALKLVDQVGYPDDAYAFAAAQVGANNPHVVRYREPAPGLLGMMFGGSSAAQSLPTDRPALGGSGGQFPFNPTPEALDAWRAARLMYR